MSTQTPPLKVERSPLMNRRQAAAFLAISPSTLDKYVGLGRIQRTRMGGSVRFHRDHLEELVRNGIPA